MVQFLVGLILGFCIALLLLVAAWFFSLMSETFKRNYIKTLLVFNTLPTE
jgi:hypothetical protein